MDHLCTPLASTDSPIRVKLTCTSGLYDDGPFLSYPSRASARWTHFEGPYHARYALEEQANNSSNEDFANFLQRWLFFGLLHEVLQEHGLFSADEYIETVDGDRMVHTRCLGDRLHQWAERCGNMADPINLRRCRHLHLCLDRTRNTLRCLLPGLGHDGFDESIKISLIALYEAISSAWDVVYGKVDDDLECPSVATTMGSFTEIETAKMRDRGWCPSVIGREIEEKSTPAFRWYIQRLQQYPADLDHSECGTSGCKTEQINQQYELRHVPDSCQCETIGPELASVAAILDAGEYPVLTVTGRDRDSLVVNVIPYRQGLRYVAMSHVWADGLGNPAAMLLPRCQILRLQEYVDSLDARSSAESRSQQTQDDVLYLWCDSLLCPVTRPEPPGMTEEQKREFYNDPDVVRELDLKKKALSHMRAVYTAAECVLVLDRGIESVPFVASDAGCIEAAARILTSRWMQRLWTLQEAALPVALWFRFKEQNVKYVDIAVRTRGLYRSSILLRTLCLDLTQRLIHLRAFRTLADTPVDLQAFSEQIRYRRCTVAADMPICAAALLGLDIDKIAAPPDIEHRMVCLWDDFGRRRPIPQNIIFADVPNLKIVGHRWAPSTLMKSLRHSSPHQSAILTPEGLCVTLPCWQLSSGVRPWVLSGYFFEEMALQNRGSLDIRGPDDRWYAMSFSNGKEERRFWRRWTTNQSYRYFDWHLLFEEELSDNNTSSHALLGVVNKGVFRRFLTVHVVQRRGDVLLLSQAAWRHAQYLRSCREYRKFQTILLVDIMLSILIRIRPALTPFARSMRRLVRAVSAHHAHGITIEWLQRRRPDAQTDEVNTAVANLRRMSNSDDAWLGSYIVTYFNGCMATVTRVYDAQEAWCVD
ncbi:hypothetical protein AMS68_002160 [Peltaster fructicola]|uniref:Heterokaryon incompatibility domain-containing protein n=1 Tax=Peltaster fructicola TaxID=286661 RepID=A0A6H0XPK6_9PEZI|nr:hypothetical protein AMS68_002160 [Peltaster fructicola]